MWVWKTKRATSKNVAITDRKEKQYVRQIKYTNQRHLAKSVTPDIGFTNKPVVQCDVPVVKNSFVDDCK